MGAQNENGYSVRQRKRRSKLTLERNRIYSKDFFNELVDGEISVIVTSPPYNIGKSYGSYNDSRPYNEYLDWMEKSAENYLRVLSSDGSLFLNIGGPPSQPWLAFDVAQRFRKFFVLQNTIIWVKSIAIEKNNTGKSGAKGYAHGYDNLRGDIAVGHLKPVNSLSYISGCFEYIFHFTKTGQVPIDKLAVGVPFQDKTNLRQRSTGLIRADKRDRGNTWFIPYETINETRPHPAVFPVKLPEMCLRLHGIDRIKVVLDPFMGIGTTALAAINLGLPFIGFDIVLEYVKIAEERIAAAKLH